MHEMLNDIFWQELIEILFKIIAARWIFFLRLYALVAPYRYAPGSLQATFNKQHLKNIRFRNVKHLTRLNENKKNDQ